MHKGLFEKIRQAVSVRLLMLKKKVNMKKFALALRSRVQAGKEQAAVFADWLRQRFGLEAWKSYARLAFYWCQFWLGKEARQVYVWAAKNWVKKHLNRDALKGYGKAALCWIKDLPKQLTKENFKKWVIALWHWLCSLPERFKSQRKYALLASCALLALWLYLGSATTLAWFTDTTPTARNTFVVGELNLVVRYKNDKVTEYTEMTKDSVVFNDEALYEPGYTQVVYLKIENDGDIAFNYKISTDVFEQMQSTNVYGQEFTLSPYLNYGVIFGVNEDDLNRALARMADDQQTVAYIKLNQHSSYDTVEVAPGNTRYAAIVIYMPETVGNVANYQKGAPIPWVQLGVTVYAQQTGTPMD